MRDAVILPLLVAVAVQRLVVRSVGDGQVSEHPFARADLRQDLITNTCADLMRLFHIDLDARRVVAHLPNVPLVDDVQLADDLDRGLPAPDVRLKLKSLAALVDESKAHERNVNARRSCVNELVIIDLINN